MIYNNIYELIGNTPIIKLDKLINENMAEIYLKLEWFNPGGSVKDRIAISMIEAAEKEGLLKPGDTIVEPTSGNTGIGIAMVAAAKGYHSILVMPDSLSIERRKILEGYGAKTIAMEFKEDSARITFESETDLRDLEQELTIKVNEIIDKGLEVKNYTLPRDEAVKLTDLSMVPKQIQKISSPVSKQAPTNI